MPEEQGLRRPLLPHSIVVVVGVIGSVRWLLRILRHDTTPCCAASVKPGHRHMATVVGVGRQ